MLSASRTLDALVDKVGLHILDREIWKRAKPEAANFAARCGIKVLDEKFLGHDNHDNRACSDLDCEEPAAMPKDTYMHIDKTTIRPVFNLEVRELTRSQSRGSRRSKRKRHLRLGDRSPSKHVSLSIFDSCRDQAKQV